MAETEDTAAAEAAAKEAAESAALTGTAGAEGSAVPPQGAQGDPSGQQDPGQLTGDGPTVETPGDGTDGSSSDSEQAKAAEEEAQRQADEAAAAAAQDAADASGKPAEATAEVEVEAAEVYEHPEPTPIAFVHQDNVTEPGVQVTTAPSGRGMVDSRHEPESLTEAQQERSKAEAGTLEGDDDEHDTDD